MKIKKIICVRMSALFTILLSVFLFTGCKKKDNELVFENSVIEAKSFFSDETFSFECDKVSQIEDGGDQYDYFYSTYTFDELKNSLKLNEYYVDDNDKMIRFLKNNNYFYLRQINSLDGYNEFIMSSERTIFIINDEVHLFIEFPNDVVDKIFNVNLMTVSSDNKTYILNYYNAIQSNDIIIEDEAVIIKNKGNKLNANDKTYTVTLSFDNEKMKVEIE